MLDKALLDILACPICKKSVAFKGNELICSSCQKAYPVRDGIPVMLTEEARDLKHNSQKTG